MDRVPKIVSLVDHLTAAALMYLGFRFYNPRRWIQNVFPFRLFSLLSRKSAANLPYWYRPQLSKDKAPIIFLHGIGVCVCATFLLEVGIELFPYQQIGLFPYVTFFRDVMKAEPDVGILLFEFLPISMHMTSSPLPARAVLLRELSNTLDALGLRDCVLASHSFGTTLGALDLPQISSLVMIDPIPILLHLPDVAFNFLYRRPRESNEWQLWYFASRDADIARTLWRCFFWHECVLWKDDLFNHSRLANVGISLSGKDQIVRSESVWRYLTGLETVPHKFEKWTNFDPDRRITQEVTAQDNGESKVATNVEVLYYPGLDHATVFDEKQRRKALIDMILRFSEVGVREDVFNAGGEPVACVDTGTVDDTS